MSDIVIYLMIGSVFTMLVDIGSIRFTKVRITNLEKFIAILIWPFIVLTFIYGWLNGNDK